MRKLIEAEEHEIRLAQKYAISNFATLLDVLKRLQGPEEDWTVRLIAALCIRLERGVTSNTSMHFESEPLTSVIRVCQKERDERSLQYSMWPLAARLLACKDISDNHPYADNETVVEKGFEIVDCVESLITLYSESVSHRKNEDTEIEIPPVTLLTTPEPSFSSEHETSPTNTDELPLSDEGRKELLFMAGFPEVLWVSLGSDALTFHKSPDCRGLKSARGSLDVEILEVSKDDALRPPRGHIGRAPCLFCWPNYIWPTTDARETQQTIEDQDFDSPEIDNYESTEAISNYKFKSGDSVKVTHGPFANLFATILEVHADSMSVVALVEIFGRETPVELKFNQFEKN